METNRILFFCWHKSAVARGPVSLSLFPVFLFLFLPMLLVIYIQIYSRVQAARICFKDKRRSRLFSLEGRAERLPEWSRSIARSRESRRAAPCRVLYICSSIMPSVNNHRARAWHARGQSRRPSCNANRPLRKKLAPKIFAVRRQLYTWEHFVDRKPPCIVVFVPCQSDYWESLWVPGCDSPWPH